MQWTDITEKTIKVIQDKTGTELIIPIHPYLWNTLNLYVRRGETILAKKNGEAYSAKTYSYIIKKASKDAKLPAHCVTHGLRKAAARRLAEVGSTPHEIASVTGHTSLREIERYTRAASQERMAGHAMERLGDI
jgi:integrase